MPERIARAERPERNECPDPGARPSPTPVGGDRRDMDRCAPRSDPGRKGFTLIEVVAALVIFSAGVLTAANLARGLANQVRDAGIRSEVVAAAEERIEQLERLPYDSLLVGIGTGTQSLDIQGLSYTRTTVVSSFNARTVSMQVTVAPDGSVSAPSQTLISYQYDAW